MVYPLPISSTLAFSRLYWVEQKSNLCVLLYAEKDICVRQEMKERFSLGILCYEQEVLIKKWKGYPILIRLFLIASI